MEKNIPFLGIWPFQKMGGYFMKNFRRLRFLLFIGILGFSLCLTPALAPAKSDTNIPSVAWSRDISAGGRRDGAPIGGFGAGTISWRFDGQFYDRLSAGSNSLWANENCGFYMYQRTGTGSKMFTRLDSGSISSGQATYYSLFPKAWVDYYGTIFPCKAKVTQFSPIIPNDYQRSSYPVGVYQWELTNPTSAPCEVGIMLTWYNSAGSFVEGVSSGNQKGLVLRRKGTDPATRESQTEFTLAGEASDTVKITYASASDYKKLAKDFKSDGILNNRTGADKNAAIAVTVKLKPQESVTIPIILAWDIPISLDDITGPHRFYKRYTRYFGRSGLNSWKIAQEALENITSWENAVDTWQTGIISNPKYPSWLKSALFNELYYYFIGGTIWEAGAASDQPDNPDEDMFSHLECFKYPFYGTSDVRFYGSWPLILLWPDLDKQCVKQFSDSITTTRKDRPAPLGTCAHDFGNPYSVFTRWNAYSYRDSTNWKDLNAKFTLMVYRDWLLTGKTDTGFLNYCWPSVKMAMAKVKSQDSDGDGLPNSKGIDQTYDDMELVGNTAYCGGLFLAACQAAKELAVSAGEPGQADVYQSWFELAQSNYEKKLWAGSYYRIDSGKDSERIMSDQLCGQWYAKACGLPGIVSDEHAAKAWRTIYETNFKKFEGGKIGPVNVSYPDGSPDDRFNQTREVWVGTAWSVAAGMAQQGLFQEAEEIGYSLYNTIWNTHELWFSTPEAWCAGVSEVRANYYMRATAVWALKHAYDITPGAPETK
jgi:non-lysosomal glucosylceramidase